MNLRQYSLVHEKLLKITINYNHIYMHVKLFSYHKSLDTIHLTLFTKKWNT
jgi:hypothetical protein